MEASGSFGDLATDGLRVGDMVCWTCWDVDRQQFRMRVGFLLKTRKVWKGGRSVLYSDVVPVKSPNDPEEVLTFSLRLASSAGPEK